MDMVHDLMGAMGSLFGVDSCGDHWPTYIAVVLATPYVSSLSFTALCPTATNAVLGYQGLGDLDSNPLSRQTLLKANTV